VTEDFSCKLTDFGCAKLVLDGNPLNTINKGTPLWMAPEVQLGKYTFSADVRFLSFTPIQKPLSELTRC
jgi:serine/threonine protein kinase